jgi:hypothetical protein
MFGDLIRRWRASTGDRAVVRNTGNATATAGGYANTGVDRRPAPAAPHYDRSPQFAADRRREAERLSVGPPVTMARQVANYVENLLVDLQANDLQLPERFRGDELRIAGCRQAVSDAIEATDKGVPGEHVPVQGGDIEAWIRERRDVHLLPDGRRPLMPTLRGVAYHTLDDLLADYRAHADHGVPLDMPLTVREDRR